MKKGILIIVGLFCTGIAMAQAAVAPAMSAGPFQEQTQQRINDDTFNFVIDNPNTIDPKKFIFEIKPGEKNEDYVDLKNGSDVPLKFSLYGADGTTTAQGSFGLKTKGQDMADVGKWISFDEKEFVLQPKETKRVKFSVDVPPGTAEGTYSGGVAAEKSKPDAGNPNIIIAVRIALRVDVKVTSNPQPVLKKYAEVSTNPFFQTYFWASAGLFLLSVGALGWSYFKDKKPAHRHK